MTLIPKLTLTWSRYMYTENEIPGCSKIIVQTHTQTDPTEIITYRHTRVVKTIT